MLAGGSGGHIPLTLYNRWMSFSVIPAQAGIQGDFQWIGKFAWAPAFAGATRSQVMHAMEDDLLRESFSFCMVNAGLKALLQAVVSRQAMLRGE